MQRESRYLPDAEQRGLASTLEATLAALLPLSRLHSSELEDARAWSGLVEIGVFSITRNERFGGSGLGATEAALIVMALGRRLASPAVLATLGAADAMRDDDAIEVAGGRVAAAYRHQGRIIMVDAPTADLVLVRDGDSAALHERGAHAAVTLDERLWCAHLSTTASLGALIALLDESQLLRLRLIDAAFLAGIAQATLEMSVAYAGQREQFGRPIGTFQAVKHHCADMAVAAQCAGDQVGFAAVALDAAREDTLLQVESALFVAGSAALKNAAQNIQIHGGIGFSDEADPHLFLKRARLLLMLAGGLDAANWRVAHARSGES